MQMEWPPSSIGSIHWLSELGMDDPLLAKSIDGLFSSGECPAVNLGHPSNSSHLDFGGGPIPNSQAAEPGHAKKRLAGVASHLNSAGEQMAPALGYERFLKTPKLDSWDVSCSQHLYSGLASLSQPCELSAKATQVSPHPSASNRAFEKFLASFPILKDENLAPRTPTVQFETGFSQISGGQESSLTNVHSAVSTGTKEASLSPSSSFCVGGQRLGFLPMAKPVHGSSAPLKTGNSQDHIMAERRRREKLSQRFIALSAIVPGLKKMDKASVLGDAIKYVKQMQERLKFLEEQTPKTLSVAVQKSSGAGSDSIKDNFEGVQPDIEVRQIEKNVLIRVHCEKKKGLLLKSLGELEKLQLSVVNANILLFTETTLDLTFTAQMEEGCELTADGIVKALHDFFKRLK